MVTAWQYRGLGKHTRVNDGASAKRKPRVFVAAENRLLREALSRALVKNGEMRWWE